MPSSYSQYTRQIFTTYWDKIPYRGPLILTCSLLAIGATATRGLVARPAQRRKPDTSKPCRYRLDNGTSATITLPDGRKLGYAEYGSPTGRAIFQLHGLPGSRLEAAALDEWAVQIGVRLVAPDRPGMGWSSPQPGRTLLDHAKDIQYLAEHLKLEKYGVMGVSGGGPYVLACAAYLPPDQLKAVAIVCGMGLPGMSKRGMRWWNYAGFTIGFRYFPGAVRFWLSRVPEAQFHLSDDERLQLLYQRFDPSKSHPKDALFWQDVDLLRLFVRAQGEAFAQGFDGAAQDGKVMCMDPGFRIEDIREDLPVYLWYGQRDVHVPPVYGEEIAGRLGGRAELRVENETHSSLTVNWRETVLKQLADSI